MTTLPSTPLALGGMLAPARHFGGRKQGGELTAKLGYVATTGFVDTEGGDGVLVDRLQLRVILDLSLQVHGTEHVQGGLLTGIPQTRAGFSLQGATKLPPGGTTLEAESLAVVSGSDDLTLAVPDQTHEGQELCGDADDGTGRLLGTGRVDDRDAAVVGSKGESITARGESDGVDPSGGAVQELTTDGIEGQTLSPHARLGTGVDALDKAGKDAGVGIGGAGSEKNRVRMPVDGGDGTPDGLLQVLGDPPVVLLLEVADGDDAVTGTDGELGLGGGPAHESSGAGDSEEDEGGLVTGGRGFPDQCVAVLGTCDDTTGVGGNVDAGDSLVVALQLIL